MAVPDLVKDTATYLGYIKAGGSSISAPVDLERYYTIETLRLSLDGFPLLHSGLVLGHDQVGHIQALLPVVPSAGAHGELFHIEVRVPGGEIHHGVDLLIDLAHEVEAVIGGHFHVHRAQGRIVQQGGEVEPAAHIGISAAVGVGRAQAAENVLWTLTRDENKPYQDKDLYPGQTQGGELTAWNCSNGETPLFSNVETAAETVDGQVYLTVTFENSVYFMTKDRQSGEWTADPSAPHANGGAYTDMCDRACFRPGSESRGRFPPPERPPPRTCPREWTP